MRATALRRAAPPAGEDPAPRPQIVVIGRESVGKSQLVASLTRRRPYVANYRGSTVSCECYPFDDLDIIDTPGILYRSDSDTTRAAIARISTADIVVMVVKGTSIDRDLAMLMPLARGHRAAIVVTYRDKLAGTPEIFARLDALGRSSGLPIECVDARRLSDARRRAIVERVRAAQPVYTERPLLRIGWQASEGPPWGPAARLFAGVGLVIPAVVAVTVANDVAAFLDSPMQDLLRPVAARLTTLPAPLADVFAGRYGLVTMGPLMLVWALPTVVLYALLLGAYKASGLLDVLTIAIDPAIRPFGLSGRDLVRVLMGFGCNVPAVVSSRACSGCARDGCIAAIAFGSACSYQMGATLAVFAAAGKSGLAVPYLLYLVTTTLLYTRLVSTPAARSAANALTVDRHVFLQLPHLSAIWHESEMTLRHFLKKAMPIFLLIALIASLLDWAGVIGRAGAVIGPAMALFNLPPAAVLPVLLASIRKDGILLLGEPGAVAAFNSGQLLTATYLAGVLLPCLVTAITIARERSLVFALRLVARQVAAAVVFTLILAWTAAVVIRLQGA